MSLWFMSWKMDKTCSRPLWKVLYPFFCFIRTLVTWRSCDCIKWKIMDQVPFDADEWWRVVLLTSLPFSFPSRFPSHIFTHVAFFSTLYYPLSSFLTHTYHAHIAAPFQRSYTNDSSLDMPYFFLPPVIGLSSQATGWINKLSILMTILPPS